MYTSPKSTSVMVAVSAAGPEEENVKSKALFDAAVAGSFWRHVPSAPAVQLRCCAEPQDGPAPQKLRC